MRSEQLLKQLGQRVRTRRSQAGWSQKQLASMSHLSTRYVSQLEAGTGNISVARLYELSRVLGSPLHELLRFDARPDIIALIGLRGAGKSTVGRKLASRLGRRFFELDALIEEQAGLGLDEIFVLHGERYYRRLEKEALSRFLAEEPSAVLATGGSLVSERPTYELLKRAAVTVWLKARPELHLERVAAQGDRRPMAGRSDPLAELRALLVEREPLYREAEYELDTSEQAPDALVAKIEAQLAREE